MRLTSDSIVRLERIPPNKWTDKDVAAWYSDHVREIIPPYL